MTEIHVTRNSKEIGVFDPAGLHLALRKAEVLPTDLAWVQGKTNWIPVCELPDDVLEIPDEPLLPPELTKPQEYYCVPVWRFVICAFATGGLYSLWWMLQNWHYIRQRDQSNIWPFFRMLFAPIWIFPLAADILVNTGGRKSWAPLIGILYLATRLCDPLPEPWWIIAVLTFLPLVPLVQRIQARNIQVLGAPLPQRLLYPRHLLICIPLLCMMVLEFSIRLQITTGFGLITGNELKARNIAYFQEHELIETDEAVLFVYSGFLVPLRTSGLILTDQQLIQYDQEDDAFHMHKTPLDDLQRLNVLKPESFKPQRIEIASKQGQLEIDIGHDLIRSQKFIRALENRLPKEEPQLRQPGSKDDDSASSPTDQ